MSLEAQSPISPTESPRSWCVFDVDSKDEQIATLEKESSDPAFWNDAHAAQDKMRMLAGLKTEVDEWRSMLEEVSSIDELIAMAAEEGDESLADTLLEDVARVTKRLDQLEFKLVLSGKHDRRDAIMALHAGAGGIESQDWAQMLARMYIRWAEGRGYKARTLDISPGEEAGFKSAVLQISGDYAYGYLKGERGVHRLVRLSPFDADHARHTSFALVEVLPEADEDGDIAIDPADLRIDVFRAGGAGGQSVQKNSTAVRITHLPTGIKVSCQNERSQYQNKAIAMRILLARLMELEVKQRAEDVARLKGAHISAEWGNQIRSYVLQPYKMVKDHRTNFETSDADGVLDGALDGFVNAHLTHTMGDNGKSGKRASADR